MEPLFPAVTIAQANWPELQLEKAAKQTSKFPEFIVIFIVFPFPTTDIHPSSPLDPVAQVAERRPLLLKLPGTENPLNVQVVFTANVVGLEQPSVCPQTFPPINPNHAMTINC